jgi:hypothetical protein
MAMFFVGQFLLREQFLAGDLRFELVDADL